MSDEGKEWRWAEPAGEQHRLSEEALRAQLASGQIAPNAPVWCPGWSEWLPAYSVPEVTTRALAAHHGAVADVPPAPRGDVMEPPPAPRYVPIATRSSTRDWGEATAADETHAGVPYVRPGAVADESNTAITLLDDAMAERVLAKDTVRREAPTLLGLATLPEHEPAPASAAAALAATLVGPMPSVPRASTGAPPRLPPKGSNPPGTKRGVPAAVARPDPVAVPRLAVPSPHPATLSPPPGAAVAPPPPARDAGGRIVELTSSALVEDPSSPGMRAVELTSSALVEDPSSPGMKVVELTSSALIEVASSAEMKAAEPAGAAPAVAPPGVSKPAPPGASRAPESKAKDERKLPPPKGPELRPPPKKPEEPSRPPRPPPRRSSAAEREEAPSPPATPSSRRVLHDARKVGPKEPTWRWVAVAVGTGVGIVAVYGVTSGGGHPERGASPTAATSAFTPAEPPSVSPAASPLALPAPVVVPTAAAAAPCTPGEPAVSVAPHALVPSGVEVQLAGAHVGLGFATGPKEAAALQLKPPKLDPVTTAKAASPEPIKRVVAEAAPRGGLVALVEADRRGDRLQGRRMLPGARPIDLGVADGSIVWAAHKQDGFVKLWPLEGEGPVEQLRGVRITYKGSPGIALTFRRAAAIWMGVAFGEASLTPRGPLFRIAGLGPVVGSPTIASEGDTILVAWADRAAATDPWGLRWVKLTPGEAPHDAVAFHPPPGGLGEQAMSPWLAAAGEGRILLTWTEGPVSGHQVRAQTLDHEGAPLGAAFTVSADGVNAGQAQAAILPSGQGLIAFLSAGGKGYEVSAASVLCPPTK